jgi:hypothetical protein
LNSHNLFAYPPAGVTDGQRAGTCAHPEVWRRIVSDWLDKAATASFIPAIGAVDPIPRFLENH